MLDAELEPLVEPDPTPVPELVIEPDPTPAPATAGAASVPAPATPRGTPPGGVDVTAAVIAEPRPAAAQPVARPAQPVAPPAQPAAEPVAPSTPPAGAAALPAEADEGGEERPAIDLLSVARRVRNLVAAVSLGLSLPDTDAARRERDLLLAQFDDYVLPRLRRMDAPLLAVIGGSTGAGKSTLTNSLARKEVSRSGVLRPTTRSPVLVHHPYDSGAFLTQRILPDLDRITSEALEPLQPVQLDAPRITALRLVPHEGVSAGLALLDAPDIDSVVEANRDLAVQLLGAADLWLFVTTAARYSDAMPWEMLRTAAARGVSVAIVLDRVPPESMQVVRAELARMLRDQGLGSSPMFTIPEQQLQNGMLPRPVVAPLLRWLHRLASDSRSRDMVVRRTLAGALDSLPARIHVLVAALDEQEAADHVLRTELDAIFANARSRLSSQLSDGTVLRGEVLAQWQRFVASGDIVRHVERSAGRLTDRLAAAVRRPPPLHTQDLGEAIHTGVRAIVAAGVLETVDQALSGWRARPGGAVLAAAAEADLTGPDLDTKVLRLVEGWLSALGTDVQDQAGQRRMPPWGMSLGTEGVAVLVTVALFSQAARNHAERTETSPDRAAADTAVAQRVLEGMFGTDAIRPLLVRAHQSLISEVQELCQAERTRLLGILDVAQVRPGAGAALRAAAQALEAAR